MMKAQIICMDDAHKNMGGEYTYNGEWSKRIYGLAKNNFKCDLCNKDIIKGEKCCAESLGLDSHPYTEWEDRYIEIK